MAEISYRRHRFPPVVIQHAVWLYLRFTLGRARHLLPNRPELGDVSPAVALPSPRRAEHRAGEGRGSVRRKIDPDFVAAEGKRSNATAHDAAFNAAFHADALN